jgi:hypothetical protein
MTDRDPVDRETEAAESEAAAIGGRVPQEGDPAQRPLEEAGQGESEGFEQSEELLREHAEHGDDGPNPIRQAFTPEAESDRETIERGEADDVLPPDGPEAD